MERGRSPNASTLLWRRFANDSGRARPGFISEPAGGTSGRPGVRSSWPRATPSCRPSMPCRNGSCVPSEEGQARQAPGSRGWHPYGIVVRLSGRQHRPRRVTAQSSRAGRPRSFKDSFRARRRGLSSTAPSRSTTVKGSPLPSRYFSRRDAGNGGSKSFPPLFDPTVVFLGYFASLDLNPLTENQRALPVFRKRP